jgi:hypothetical protein
MPLMQASAIAIGIGSVPPLLMKMRTERAPLVVIQLRMSGLVKLNLTEKR